MQPERDRLARALGAVVVVGPVVGATDVVPERRTGERLALPRRQPQSLGELTRVNEHAPGVPESVDGSRRVESVRPHEPRRVRFGRMSFKRQRVLRVQPGPVHGRQLETPTPRLVHQHH